MLTSSCARLWSLVLLCVSFALPLYAQSPVANWSVLAENSMGTAVAVSSDGKTIYSGTSGGFVRAVETATGTVLWSRSVTNPVVLLALASDDKSLLVGTVKESSTGNYPQNALFRIDAAAGKTSTTYVLPRSASYEQLTGAAFAGEGQYVIASLGIPGYSDGTLCRYTASGETLLNAFDHPYGSLLASDDGFDIVTAGDSSVWRWDVRHLDAQPTELPIGSGVTVIDLTLTPSGHYAGVVYNDRGSTRGAVVDLRSTPKVLYSDIALTDPKLLVVENLGQFVGSYYSLANYELATGKEIGLISGVTGPDLAVAAHASTLIISGTAIDAIDLSRDTATHSVTRNISSLRETRFLPGDTTVAVLLQGSSGASWRTLHLKGGGKVSVSDTIAPDPLDESRRFRITTSRHHDTTYYTSLHTGRTIMLPRYSNRAYISPDERSLATYEYSGSSCGGPSEDYLSKYSCSDLTLLRSATYIDYGPGYFAYARDLRYLIRVDGKNDACILDADTFDELGKASLDQSGQAEYASTYYLPSTDLVYSISGNTLSAFSVSDLVKSKRVVIAMATVGSTYQFDAAPSENTLLLISEKDWRLLDGYTLKLLASGSRNSSYSSEPDLAFSSDLRHELQLTDNGVLRYSTTTVNQPVLHVETGNSTIPAVVQVVPNPVRDITELRLAGVDAGDATVELYDVTGRVVMVTDLGQTTLTTLDCSRLAAGSYVARVTRRATGVPIGSASVTVVR